MKLKKMSLKKGEKNNQIQEFFLTWVNILNL